MNIKQAKEQIKNAMTAYFTRNDLGNYVIPPEKQRPVFLVGPPGIGKTAIMEQIASEMGVGLLSYSMTHHTRQSAIGLPTIVHRTYCGQEFDVTEYTMSEIIASVYELMDRTGVREGILFLDEINCVSETLSPLMLQFLQYKVFGRHRLPDGWIVVTAGNPPEYNDSVREFDIATLDRLKKIVVDPDLDVWKEYAYSAGVHPSILTFLEIMKSYFFSVSTGVDGKRLVTPRGWEDLSQMITLFEAHGLTVNEDLIGQYVQDEKIAKEFAAYYDLFNKYKSDYQVEEILAGRASEEVRERAKNAPFDECYSLIGLLIGGVNGAVRPVIAREALLHECRSAILAFRSKTSQGEPPDSALSGIVEEEASKIEAGRASGSLSPEARDRKTRMLRFLRDLQAKTAFTSDPDEAYDVIRKVYENDVGELRQQAAAAGEMLNNLFSFAEAVFGDGQQMLIIVTELTADVYTAKFIGEFGCEAYFRHNKELLFYERQKEIIGEIEDLGLDSGAT